MPSAKLPRSPHWTPLGARVQHDPQTLALDTTAPRRAPGNVYPDASPLCVRNAAIRGHGLDWVDPPLRWVSQAMRLPCLIMTVVRTVLAQRWARAHVVRTTEYTTTHPLGVFSFRARQGGPGRADRMRDAQRSVPIILIHDVPTAAASLTGVASCSDCRAASSERVHERRTWPHPPRPHLTT